MIFYFMGASWNLSFMVNGKTSMEINGAYGKNFLLENFPRAISCWNKENLWNIYMYLSIYIYINIYYFLMLYSCWNRNLCLIVMPCFYISKRLGQGRDRALQYLRENPLVCHEIEKVWLLDTFLYKYGWALYFWIWMKHLIFIFNEATTPWIITA